MVIIVGHLIIVNIAALIAVTVTVTSQMPTMTLTVSNTGVCEKTFLRRRVDIGMSSFRAPNQGLESSFCLWTAGQGLAQKECFFPDADNNDSSSNTHILSLFGIAIVYTATTQRGWCTEAFVSTLTHLQSQKSLPGGGDVLNPSSRNFKVDAKILHSS